MTITLAPKALEICTAMIPVALEPPSISTRLPDFKRPTVTSELYDVSDTSGNAAACWGDVESGIKLATDSLMAMNSDKVPVL